MSAIAVQGLTKDFGSLRVVDDVTFDAPHGAVTGFVGANGSGKTTTMRMMLELIQPTRGQALFSGVRYGDLVQPRREVGAVVDRIGAHPAHTARDHLTMVATASGISRGRVDECLDQVGLIDSADRPLRQYSMGMVQRCALAVATLGAPPVLMLDEPANGLDPGGIRWLRKQMRDWADEGRAVLVSTHQLAELSVIVDHLVVIDRAAVVFAGPAADLQRGGHSLEDAVFELVADRADGPDSGFKAVAS